MTMYLEHFGLREAPFKITPHTEFFFSGANRGETLEALIYAITSGEGIVKVTGEVGAGKTMLCRVLMERLPKSVETIYFAVPSLSPDELLATIANDLGVGTDGINITKLIRALQGRLIEIHSSGKRVVALIDEAHAMPVETLDQIRLLSNLETSHDKLIQIVLFGQPELDQHLSLPNIRQLKERITHGFNLLPLPAQDIKDYLNFRLRAAGYHGPDLFSKDALRLIAEASEGLTRRINIYADKTLLAAYAAGTHTITTDHVRAAITDTQIVLPGARSTRNKFWLGVASSLLLGLAFGFLLGRYSVSPAPEKPALAATMPNGISKDASVANRDITKSPAAAPSMELASDRPAAGGTASFPASSPPATPSGGTEGTSSPVQVTPNSLPTPAAAPKAPAVAAVAPSATTTTSSASPKNKPSVNWLGKRLVADAARVAAMSEDRYTIQLMNADQRAQQAIEAFLRTAGRELNPDLIMMFPTGTTANPRVSVLYGNFEGATDASAGLEALPANVSKFRPYARSFGVVNSGLRPGLR